MRLDFITYVLENISQKKTRSFLTVLSILIGVAAIFTIISFGLGLDKYVNTLAEDMGTDKLWVQAKGIGAPGTDDTFSISREEEEFIAKIGGVSESEGFYMKIGEIESNDEKRFYFVASIDSDKQDFVDNAFTVSVERGRNLKKGELTKIVLGYNYQFDNKIFSKGLELGDKVTLNDKEFKVVGFYEEVGSPYDDGNIYLTEEAMEQLYDDVKDKFGFVFVEADEGVDPDQLADKITEKLRKKRGLEEGKEDFYVQTFADALETFSAILGVLNGILLLIAFVSLIVAFVNIMNTMYTAVTERTKEIGIMKAIGAQQGDIITIFLIESGFLGLVGGIVGIVLGWIISSFGGSIAAASGYSFLKPAFPLVLILGCMAFATFVGLLSGVLPAWQASKLKPVDALRYE